MHGLCRSAMHASVPVRSKRCAWGERLSTCVLAQGLVLRVATYVVLRWGSHLSSFSLYKFFTFCWQRLSAQGQQRWSSLRQRAGAAWGRQLQLPAHADAEGPSSEAAADAQQPLLSHA